MNYWYKLTHALAESDGGRFTADAEWSQNDRGIPLPANDPDLAYVLSFSGGRVKRQIFPPESYPDLAAVKKIANGFSSQAHDLILNTYSQPSNRK